jgi:hypothetical protein
MPKRPVNDPITDQEMAFAHIVLSGTMNDRQAAETAGLNPESAAYIKAKPRVRAYMIEHRAAVKERLVNQEATGLRKLNIGRDQVLARLWELANLAPETTRGVIAGQIKALSMIVAIEVLIPDRAGHQNGRGGGSEQSPPLIYEAKWRQHRKEGPTTPPDQPTGSTLPEEAASFPSGEPSHETSQTEILATPSAAESHGTQDMPDSLRTASDGPDQMSHTIGPSTTPFSVPKRNARPNYWG